uniref:NADH-ubiquinone oxidoreductase chain 5 n=1 Tax=Amblyjoppa sp. ZJUH_2016002 TaxID=2491150 RepID=A0A3Q8U9U3_9HYME|nr:NADH dehydrogenase subunit 5 [Amblyjoppa sp. ZJUH_2016002]
MFYLMNFYLMLMVVYLFNLFMYFYINQIIMYMEFELVNMFSIKMELLILLDWVSILFISVVFFISLMVIFYSFEYMKDDININRFIMLVYMFILSMMLMILSPNLISILVGWDGLGLVSYCLVIYYQSVKSLNSGMVTVLSNRLGDIMILISVSLMMIYGSWNYMFMNKMNNLIYMMLILASFTKSAQIPFSSWLPLAMAAPTPVSSLVHSSTLVTAGVYLLIRLNYLLMSNLLINLMMLISLMTMFLAGMGANFEFDLKKIIALSTLSQLGVMIFCLSMKLMENSMFHLLTHAMFKSLLFMCAGVIIHNMGGKQDIRMISMTLYNLPLISMMFNCASLSLCGIPFLSGFFSKDLILEMYLMNLFNSFIYMILFISMGLSIMYTMRLIYYSFIKVPQLTIYNKYFSFKSYMGLSMFSLFFFSIFMGLLLSWILLSSKNMVFLSMKMKLMIYFFLMMGIIMGGFLPKFFLEKIMLNYLNQFMIFFSMLWFMPLLYTYWISSMFKFSEKFIFNLEFGWIEYFGGFNFKEFMLKFFYSEFFSKNYYYILIFIVMMMMILLY